MAEVHDCFTPTELVLMEDLGFAARGTAWKEVLAGTFDLDGERFRLGGPPVHPRRLQPHGPEPRGTQSSWVPRMLTKLTISPG